MNPRIARWFLKMIYEYEYDFVIEHRGGNKMAHVDALSRGAVEQEREETIVAEKILAIDIDTEDFLATMQQQDDKLAGILKTLQKPATTNAEKQIRQL